MSRPSNSSLSVIEPGLEGYESSASTGYLLTPDTRASSSSDTPSPLASPVYLVGEQELHMASVFDSQRYQLAGETQYGHYQASSLFPRPSTRQPNLARRASMAVEPTYYAFPRAASSSSSSIASNLNAPLSNLEQDSLPSWRRDFDKISDASTKSRWAQELYSDFKDGRIPTTGRGAQDIIDWETCVAKVDGKKDAEATAKMLVAAQERKAELQMSSSRTKSISVDKEPPRRQNKFICYRSLRSSQLASHFASFKQSQFSAITSLEWKEIDTDWWGDVANLVEEVRRAKYIGQLDLKGNPLRRASVDHDSYAVDGSLSRSPKAKKSKALKQGRNSVTRFDPYGEKQPARPNMPRAVSYISTQQRLLTPPSVQYRHSIDMGTISGLSSPQYCEESAMGVYSEPATYTSSFPTLTAIPQSPMSVTTHGSTYTPAPAPAADHSFFSDPFAFSSHITPSTPPRGNSSPSHALSTPYTQMTSYASPQYYTSPSYTLPSAPVPIYEPQVYLPPSTWTPHGRGQTNELMEMYTLAQDYVPVSGYPSGQAPCFVGGGGNWSSHHPAASMSSR